MLTIHRAALRRRVDTAARRLDLYRSQHLHISSRLRDQESPSNDPRLASEGNVIRDAFADIRDDYATPRNPIVLAHGLFGFDEIHPAGGMLGGVQYWSGIEDALAKKGIEVITAAVPPSGRVEVRAKRLAEDIERRAGGKAVNIIASVYPFSA